MKTFLLFILCAFSASFIHAQSARLTWAKAPDFETSTGGVEATNRLTAVDPSGNSYVTGTLYGTVDFDPGPATANLTSTASFSSAFIAKYDPQGVLIWAKHIPATKLLFPLGLTLDGRGSLLITGTFQDSVDFDPGAGLQRRKTVDRFTYAGYVLKLDAAGTFVWVTTMDDASTNPLFTGGAGGSVIVTDTSGNAYVAGDFSYVVRFGTIVLQAEGAAPTSAADIFVCKLSGATGAVSWVKAYTGNADSRAAFPKGIALDAGGSIYIVGDLDSNITGFKPVDFDPGPGKYELSPVGATDMYVLKLKPDGSFGWVKLTGGRGYDYTYNLMVDAAANVYIAGSFEDTVDFDPGAGVSRIISAGDGDGSLLKLDSSGAFIWVKTIGGPGYQSARLLARDPAGNIYVGGNFDSTTDFNPGSATFNIASRGEGDAFILKLDPSASFTWAAAVGGRGDESLYGLGLEATGNVYLRGAFNDTADFDPCATVSNLFTTDRDHTFLVKLGQSLSNCPTAGVESVSSEAGMWLYPNPAGCSVTIKCENGFQNARIRLQNISGQIVKEWQSVAGNTMTLEISGVPAGMYFVEVSAGDGSVKRLRLAKQ